MSSERMPDPESHIRLLRSAPMEEKARLRSLSPGPRDPEAQTEFEEAVQLLLQRASHETAATLRRRFAEERWFLNPGLSDRTLRREFIDPLLAEISDLLLSLAEGQSPPPNSWR